MKPSANVTDLTSTKAPITGDDKPNPVDVYAGSRLRERRLSLGLSQEKVGEAMGLTFQQVQKYERGANRIGASRLWDMSQVLGCPVSYFFEGFDGDDGTALNGDAATKPAPEQDDLTGRRETRDLVRVYYNIRDPQVRRRICELTKSLADGAENADGEG